MTRQHIDTDELVRELHTILTRSAGVDENELRRGSDSSLVDLGLDSLAVMELQAVVKGRYEVRIPDEALGMTIPEIAAHIAEHVSEGE